MDGRTEVLNEMHEAAKKYPFVQGFALEYYARRLEEVDGMEMTDEESRKVQDLVDGLYDSKKEILRLRSELKPILEVHVPEYDMCDSCAEREFCGHDKTGETCEWRDIVETVRKAKSNHGEVEK